MDFGSFENSIDKNIETDKASDKFDQQLQAYKDAGNSLTLAKSGVEMATASMHEAKDKLSEASDKANTVTKAIEAYIGKVKDITVKAKVDDADMEQAINNRKKLIEDESKLLEDHRKANKKAFWTAVFIVVLCWLIYVVISWSIRLGTMAYDWIASLF